MHRFVNHSDSKDSDSGFFDCDQPKDNARCFNVVEHPIEKKEHSLIHSKRIKSRPNKTSTSIKNEERKGIHILVEDNFTHIFEYLTDDEKLNFAKTSKR